MARVLRARIITAQRMLAAGKRDWTIPSSPLSSILGSNAIGLRGFGTIRPLRKDAGEKDGDDDSPERIIVEMLEEDVNREIRKQLEKEKVEKEKKMGGNKDGKSKKEESAEGAKKSPEEIITEVKTKGTSSASTSGSSAASAGNKSSGSPRDRALQKTSIPEIYPQVMALPIAKRPLFPGFYKAVTIRDPHVTAAIQEMMKRGQPYIGAFLFKDENMDKDIIDNIDEVHPVGVFAQITSISTYPVHGEGETTLTAVLYPHRRIKISTLLPPKKAGETATAIVEESSPDPTPAPEENKGDVVASFEEVVDDAPAPSSAPTISPYATSFLNKYEVSLVDVENLTEEPYDHKSPVIRAVTSEIVNVFKEVANLNPLFRDQISTFSMSQSAGNVIDEPAKLADFAAAVSAGEVQELQDVLETLNVEERLSKALVVLKKELMNAQLQSKISKDVEAKIQKRQREYWLMEQMKGIRRELGIESDGKDKLVENFKEKSEKLAMPEAVKKVFDEVCAPVARFCLTFFC